MAPMDLSKAVQTVTTWLHGNLVRVHAAYLQRGGWEGWAQVEIATSLMNIAGGSANIERETPGIYTGRQTPDVTISNNQKISNQIPIFIELKCESLNSGFNALIRGLLKDIKKAQSALRANASSEALAICLTVSKQTTQALRLAQFAQPELYLFDHFNVFEEKEGIFSPTIFYLGFSGAGKLNIEEPIIASNASNPLSTDLASKSKDLAASHTNQTTISTASTNFTVSVEGGIIMIKPQTP